MRIAKEHSIFLEEERETQFYTNVEIDSRLTRMEAALTISAPKQITLDTVRMVEDLNDRSIRAAKQIASFKSKVRKGLFSVR